MKLRRVAEDFCVVENVDLDVDEVGPIAVFELTKRHITTLDAIDWIAREWHIPRDSISYAGMKDRHAVTKQFITVAGGPFADLETELFSVKAVGRTHRSLRAVDILSNQFKIVMRSLSPEEVEAANAAIPFVQETGVPNYFDDQRFGSLPPSREWITAAWIQRDYEQALWLAFAEPLPLDSPDEREQKTIMRDHWGDWITCKAKLSRSHRRSVVTYLCDHPTRFKIAWKNVQGDLRGIYLSAFQSWLWNECVADLFRAVCEPNELRDVELKHGPVPMPTQLSTESAALILSMELPLPSARTKVPVGLEADVMHGTLNRLGWPLDTIKVAFPRDKYFARARRRLFIQLQDFAFEFDNDELEPGKQKLSLSFNLPRGSYATMVVKSLTR